MNDPDRLYKIIRFRRDGPNQVLERGLTLDEAQAHCEREDTHGEGWFDGYDLDVLTDETAMTSMCSPTRTGPSASRTRCAGAMPSAS